MARVATSKRACARRRMEISMIGVSPIGTSGLGRVTVKGRSRVPLPPARMTAYLIAVSYSARAAAGSLAAGLLHMAGGLLRLPPPLWGRSDRGRCARSGRGAIPPPQRGREQSAASYEPYLRAP